MCRRRERWRIHRAAHLIPEDSGLWSVARYNGFCEQRERALAAMLRDLLFSYGVT